MPYTSKDTIIAVQGAILNKSGFQKAEKANRCAEHRLEKTKRQLDRFQHHTLVKIERQKTELLVKLETLRKILSQSSAANSDCSEFGSYASPRYDISDIAIRPLRGNQFGVMRRPGYTPRSHTASLSDIIGAKQTRITLPEKTRKGSKLINRMRSQATCMLPPISERKTPLLKSPICRVQEERTDQRDQLLEATLPKLNIV